MLVAKIVQFNFNSRPSARGDAEKNIRKPLDNVFQFTPLREGRRRDEFRVRQGFISIHAPPRGATRLVGDPRRAFLFQFTPLREGRRDFEQEMERRKRISIHAPPRGATRLPIHTFAEWKISIHAPPRGATPAQSRRCLALVFQFTPLREGRRMLGFPDSPAILFQFTPLREGRQCFPNSNIRFPGISIHAPPRGAT